MLVARVVELFAEVIRGIASSRLVRNRHLAERDEYIVLLTLRREVRSQGTTLTKTYPKKGTGTLHLVPARVSEHNIREPVRKRGQAPCILSQHEYPNTTSGSQSPFSEKGTGTLHIVPARVSDHSIREPVPVFGQAIRNCPEIDSRTSGTARAVR